jgi:hypothetical protein
MAKKEKPQFVSIETIWNNPNDRAKLQGYIDEAVRCKLLIADQNESIKGIKEVAAEEIGLQPKLFSSLVSISLNHSYLEKKDEIDQLDSAISMLFDLE